MKLLIVRHCQSHDDTINAYGGWADFDLSEEGQKQAQESAEKIAKLDIKFEKLIVSPLKRAQQTAGAIAEKLGLVIATDLYFKERNTYGLLCGVVKTEAETDYPELFTAYENGEYVVGQERIEDVNERAELAFERILVHEKAGVQSMIVVTHGMFLKQFFPTVLGKKLVKKEDGGFILFDLVDGKFTELLHDGIEIE